MPLIIPFIIVDSLLLLRTLKDEEAKRMFPNYDYDEDGKFSRNDHLYRCSSAEWVEWVRSSEMWKVGESGEWGLRIWSGCVCGGDDV